MVEPHAVVSHTQPATTTLRVCQQKFQTQMASGARPPLLRQQRRSPRTHSWIPSTQQQQSSNIRVDCVSTGQPHRTPALPPKRVTSRRRFFHPLRAVGSTTRRYTAFVSRRATFAIDTAHHSRSTSQQQGPGTILPLFICGSCSTPPPFAACI